MEEQPDEQLDKMATNLDPEQDNLDEVEMDKSNDEDAGSSSTGCCCPSPANKGEAQADDGEVYGRIQSEPSPKGDRIHGHHDHPRERGHLNNNSHHKYDDDDDRLKRKDNKSSSPRISEPTRDKISSVRAERSNIICATNLSPVITLDQARTFFGFLGDIIDIALYQYERAPDKNFQVCFVEFAQHSSVLMAQHLTNTIFIDRAIFVLPYNKSKIPADKEAAEEMGYVDTEYITTINPDVSTQVATGANGAQVITTSDPRLTAANLQQYPQLPINTDPTRIEEIRRTLYIGNLDSSKTPDEVLDFFNDIGEVKYIRVAGDETQPTRFAFVEFTNQSSVANALLYNGYSFGIKALKINHSNNPIVKPQPKLEIQDPSKKHYDSRSGHRDSGSRDRHHSSRNDKKRDRRDYHDRRMSPRDHRSSSRRDRSRDRDTYSRSRRDRSCDRSARRSRSRDDSLRRRSRSKEPSSKRRRSRSRSSERRSKHKSSSSSRRR